MKRILIAPVLALGLAGCETVDGSKIDGGKAQAIAGAVIAAAAPAILESLNNSGFDPLQVSPAQLPLWGAVCNVAMDANSPRDFGLNVSGVEMCGFILDALAAAPVDPADELSPPIPVEKPADS